MKRKLTLTMAILMVLALIATGCGGNNDSQSSASSDSEPSSSTYPEKTIKMIVPWSAGGGADTLARFLCNEASKYLPNDQTIVVENIGGGGAVTGTMEVLNSDPDGYTIGWTSNTPMVLQPLQGNGTYTFDDMEFVAQVASDASYLAVRADSEWQTAEELINWIKENPGEFHYSSGGIGGEQHICYTRLFKLAGVIDDCVYVPTKSSSETMTALLGGHVQATCALANQVFKDELRVLVSFGTGDETYGEGIPTVSDLGYDYSVAKSLSGIIAPKGTDQEAIDILYDAFSKALNDPAVLEKMKDMSYNALISDGKEMKETLKNTYSVYKEILGELDLLAE